MQRRYYYDQEDRQEPNYCGYCLILLGILSVFCVVALGAFNIDSFQVTSLIANLSHDAEISMAFEGFKQDYGKVYENQNEEAIRKAIFKANFERINEINKQGNNFVLGVNKFADLTEEEFRMQYLSKPEYIDYPQVDTVESSSSYTDVRSKDWVEDGYMNSIRDQGNCGSCWTFASVAAAEAIFAIKSGNAMHEEFSEQQLVDCFKSELSDGCNGGERYEALQYIAEKGLVRRKDYPYKARNEKCTADKLEHTFMLKGYKNITKGKNRELAEEIWNNPVTIGVNASPFEFRFYKGGILDKACPSDEINHAILAVGVGSANNVMIWKVRNSWGTKWGENGYIRIKRQLEDGPGLCGIALKACNPVRL